MLDKKIKASITLNRPSINFWRFPWCITLDAMSDCWVCRDSKNCSWPLLTKYTPLALFMHFLQNAYIGEDDLGKLPQMHSKFKNAFPNDKTCAEFSKISFRWKIASACEIHIVNALSCLDVPPFTTTGFPTMDMWTTWTSNFVEMCSF